MTYFWLFLLGILFAIIAGLVCYLLKVKREYSRSYASINQTIQKETADRIHIEETKQKLEKALLQGQKLQAIGTLAGGIAHDFNNILYAITGYVELSREDVPKDSIVYKNLGKVCDAAKRGQELVARILSFSRRQHHDFYPIQIKETIEGVLALIQPAIPASISIQFHSISDDFEVLGNQTQLHQVLVNIINNAVDAMDGEGLLIIQLSVIDSNDELLKQFPEAKPKNYCKIEVIDKGHGMDQPTMERIFEPFFTTKEVGKGTGLGLATVHSIVKEHQGEVLVQSQLGHGTTFTLLFPEYEGE